MKLFRLSIHAIHIEGIAVFFARVPRWMGENPFIGFLLLLLFALLISSGIFYASIVALREPVPANGVVQTKANEQALEGIIQIWQEQEQAVNQAGQERMKNIFAAPLPVRQDELTE